MTKYHRNTVDTYQLAIDLYNERAKIRLHYIDLIASKINWNSHSLTDAEIALKEIWNELMQAQSEDERDMGDLI